MLTPTIHTIRVGDYELLESRILQVLDSEETVLSFGDSALSFKFESNEKGEPEIRGDFFDKKMQFMLSNITDQSYGTTEFIKFATNADGKDIYISFRIHSLKDKRVRSLEYSLYVK